MSMRLRLGNRWGDWLCTLEESGMGCQRVDVQLKDGREIKGVAVFNAEAMGWPGNRPPIESEDIAGIRPSMTSNDGPRR